VAPREVWASAFQAKEPTNRIAAAGGKATDSFRIVSPGSVRRPLKPRTSESLQDLNAISASPPKSDMCGALAHVCFGPKADIETRPQHVRFTSTFPANL
jgi:hypothetical protein